MNFYIRETFDSPIEGPLPPATIISKIETGEITLDWLANPDLRESSAEIERSPKRDWTPIRIIHDLCSRWVKKELPRPSSESEPTTGYGCFRFAAITLLVAAALLAIAFAVIYAGCHSRIN